MTGSPGSGSIGSLGTALLLNPIPQSSPPYMALSTLFKPNPKFFFYPSRPPPPLLHFSSSSSSSNDQTAPAGQQPLPSTGDAFREIKAKTRPNSPGRPSPVYNRPNNADAFEGIRKTLAEFQGRSAAAAHPGSFTDIFQKSHANRPAASRNPSSSFSGKPSVGSRLTGEGSGIRMKGMLFKGDSVEQLGRKLVELRPDAAKRDKEGGWFSLEELRGRLKRLKEIEEETAAAKKSSDGFYGAMRQSLILLEEDANKKSENRPTPIFSFLGLSGPDCTKGPPKEHLVEKYFHPDNMSASEKLKIELAKVRAEFKMSESDCGSARVQVAQLTTKIRYLSSVLKKKDKHSLKGLQAMVQQRKKLLKYLRKTDWDSYCLVLDKLGLRDNADYKLMRS